MRAKFQEHLNIHKRKVYETGINYKTKPAAQQFNNIIKLYATCHKKKV